MENEDGVCVGGMLTPPACNNELHVASTDRIDLNVTS